MLAGKKPDDTVTLTLLLAEKTVEMKVKLEPKATTRRRVGGPTGGGWNRGRGYWTKPTYRLAIICVEYPDVKHNAKITAKAWEEAMFSRRDLHQDSATGQTVHGSMNDYYLEQSYGNLKVEGKAFAYVEVEQEARRSTATSGNRDRPCSPRRWTSSWPATARTR